MTRKELLQKARKVGYTQKEIREYLPKTVTHIIKEYGNSVQLNLGGEELAAIKILTDDASKVLGRGRFCIIRKSSAGFSMMLSWYHITRWRRFKKPMIPPGIVAYRTFYTY